MAETEPVASRKQKSRGMRRFGYAVAAVVNLVMLVVVNNLLAWDLLPWLTDDFERLLPILNLSLVASIVTNIVYMWFDPRWFKSLTQIGLSVLSLLVALRTFRVFPFDFSGYDVDWEPITRIILVLIMVGIIIGIIVESVRFVTDLVRAAAQPDRAEAIRE